MLISSKLAAEAEQLDKMEDAYNDMKAATGVESLSVMVDRYLNQEGELAVMVDLIETTEQNVQRLQARRKEQEANLEEMRTCVCVCVTYRDGVARVVSE
jgi:hypothetical protein